jgi:hypothetical protein
MLGVLGDCEDRFKVLMPQIADEGVGVECGKKFIDYYIEIA